jgi:hypothetical protein
MENTGTNSIDLSVNLITIPEKQLNRNSKPIQFYVLESGCWKPAARHIPANGFAQVKRNGKLVYLRRFVYEFYKGEILPGYRLINTCPNRWCCNPRHLEIRKPCEISPVLGRTAIKKE